MSQNGHERFNQSPEAGAVAPCWNCKQPVAARALFCHSCGAVQAPGQLDHFARLGVVPGFDLDLDRLEKQYLGFQRAMHPDRFVTKTPKERAIAEQQAVSMNEAYETLKDPLRRAAYLLERAGKTAAVDKDQTVHDPELLMEAMEAREQLSEVATVDALEKLQVEAGAKAIDLLSQLSKAFAADDLDAANRAATRMKYWRKFLEESRARRTALEDADMEGGE
jgi:molecular chaperone HscB